LRSVADVDQRLKEQLTSDFRTADITDFEKQMLDYVEKITTGAYAIDRNYIDSLKSHGLTDRILHDIVQVTAYFNYVNRLADGLGVELESDEAKR